MRKYILAIVCLLSACCVFSQGSHDAMKYAGRDLYGTARYVGMSGAFAALGGDPSAVHDNPASLGVFRSSDASISLDINTERTTSTSGQDQYIGRRFRISCGQVNWVINFKTENTEHGLVSHSLMFGYKRLKNYNRDVNAVMQHQNNSFTDYLAEYTQGLNANQLNNDNSYSDVNVGWLSILGYQGFLINPDTINQGNWFSLLEPGEQVNSAFSMVESGWLDEYIAGWGANLSNRLYLGASFGVRAMMYSKSVTYGESFGNGGNFDLSTYYNASGIGVNGTFGVIYRPVNNTRFGLSFQTPTLMNNKEAFDAKVVTRNVTTNTITIESPRTTTFNYRVTNPWRITAGLASTFSNVGLISFQYDYEAYKTMKFSSNTGKTDIWAYDNNEIKNSLHNLHTFRVGGEVLIGSMFAIRAGYAYTTTFAHSAPIRNKQLNDIRTDTETSEIRNQHYISAGFGVRSRIVAADIAYQCRISREQVLPYTGSNVFDLNAISHRVVLTIAIK